jgi:hypothetical protein
MQQVFILRSTYYLTYPIFNGYISQPKTQTLPDLLEEAFKVRSRASLAFKGEGALDPAFLSRMDPLHCAVP